MTTPSRIRVSSPTNFQVALPESHTLKRFASFVSPRAVLYLHDRASSSTKGTGCPLCYISIESIRVINRGKKCRIPAGRLVTFASRESINRVVWTESNFREIPSPGGVA